jgi:hypothetical protein
MTAQRRKILKNEITRDFRRIQAHQCPRYLPRAWWQKKLPARERERLKRELLAIFRRAEWFARNTNIRGNP